MTIGSTSSTLYTSVVSSVGSSTAPSAAGAPPDAGAVAGGVSVGISRPGQLLSELKDLATSDPAKFKSVTADIAQKLKDAASAQGGSASDFLNKLADRFSAASQSGNASDLAPKAGGAQGHHHGHGGHHHAAEAAAGGQSAATGGGPFGAIEQTVQSIVSTALSSSSSISTAAT
jgi:hypothetical protein